MMAKKNTHPPVKSRSTITVRRTDSPNTIKHPLVHDATMGKRRRWAAWQDWLSVGLGAYFALAWLWIPGALDPVFMTLGILVVVVSLWAGTTASSTLAEFVKMLLGAAIILSSLFNMHVEERTAIMTSWVVGAALIFLSVHASYRNRSGRSATNPHDRQRA